MINIFEVFLPQLLRYPNPNDPLNGEAAALLMRHPKEYDIKVKGTSCLINTPYPLIASQLTILDLLCFTSVTPPTCPCPHISPFALIFRAAHQNT